MSGHSRAARSKLADRGHLAHRHDNSRRPAVLADRIKLADTARRYWDPEAQTRPRHETRRIQDERLGAAVQRAYDLAPFFHDRFDAAGVHPRDIHGVSDLHRLPVFDKDDLRADEARHRPFGSYRSCGPRESIRFATSTGTSGRPTITLWTAKDLALEFELSARTNWRAGLRPGDTVVNAHPGYTNGGESFIVGDCRYMAMLPISLGPPTTPEDAAHALRLLEGIDVDWWRLYPAAAQRFREAAAQYNIAVELPPAEQTGPLAQYDRLSAGQECISVLGGSCARGNGAHIAEDYAIVEVLDIATLQPVDDGERGLLVVTSLDRDNPMIRYNLGDIIRLDSSPCDCGETSRRGFYEGRVQDIVSIGDQTILPIDVWLELPPEVEFTLVRRPEADHLRIRIDHEPAGDLRDRLELRLKVPVLIEQCPAGSLTRAAFKPKRVIDEPH